MIVCVYAKVVAPFVEPVIEDLAAAARARHADLAGVRLEDLARTSEVVGEVSTLYLLPQERPLDDESGGLLESRFPHATIANPAPAHDLCRDRLAFCERMLERGIAIPETVVTESVEEAQDFIGRHEHAVMREMRSPGSRPAMVAFRDVDRNIVGETRGRRYVVELDDRVERCRLDHGVLSVPPPYLLQRLVTSIDRHGVLVPAQTLRAFVVGSEIPYWTEAYRDRVRRPADFVFSAGSGSRRFVQVVGDEATKLARRVARAVGMRYGAVDLVRADSGYVALGAVTDGATQMIDRSFKALPEYRDAFNLDRHIAGALVDRLTADSAT